MVSFSNGREIDAIFFSTQMSCSSRIHLELAVFNDRTLAWVPLIEPVVDERGEIVSPWYLTCSTVVNENQLRYPLEHPAVEEERSVRPHRVGFFSSQNKKLLIYCICSVKMFGSSEFIMYY